MTQRRAQGIAKDFNKAQTDLEEVRYELGMVGQQCADAIRDKAAALQERQAALDLLEEKEALWASTNKASQSLLSDHQNKIRGLEKEVLMEKEKTSGVRNELAATRLELEKALAAKEEAEEKSRRISHQAAHAVEQFKESAEGVAWLQEGISDSLTNAGLKLMKFANSQVEGIDWSQHELGRLLLSFQQEDEGDEGESIMEGSEDVTALADGQDPVNQTEITPTDGADSSHVVTDQVEVPPGTETNAGMEPNAEESGPVGGEDQTVPPQAP